MAIPIRMTAVLTDKFGENRQEIIKPVPVPVKKSITDFSRLMIPIVLCLSMDCTIFVSSLSRVSREISN